MSMGDRSTTHVTVASNYSYKDESGEWRDDPHWNEVVVVTLNLQLFLLFP